MREAQDSASEDIPSTRIARGGLPKLKPGTVDHTMKPPQPHRRVGTAQHRQTSRPLQWHTAPGDQKANRRRARRPSPSRKPTAAPPSAAAAAERRLPPSGGRPAKWPPPTTTRTGDHSRRHRATAAARPGHPEPSDMERHHKVRQPSKPYNTTHNKDSGHPNMQPTAPCADNIIIFRQCSQHL